MASRCALLNGTAVLLASSTAGNAADNSMMSGSPGPVFEAPNGAHVWLNQCIFVGTLVAVTGLLVPAVRIRIYQVT